MFQSKYFASALAAAAVVSASAAPAYAYVQPIWLEVNQSYYMPQTSAIKRVAVTNPKIADVKVINNHAINIVALASGSTSLTVWNVNGMRQEFTVSVSPADSNLAALIQKAIGLPNVKVEKIGDKILLRGTVMNQRERDTAVKIASLYLGQVSNDEGKNNRASSGGKSRLQDDDDKSLINSDIQRNDRNYSDDNVINLLELENPDQINIEAEVIEINSDAARDLGIEYGSDLSNPGIFTFADTKHSYSGSNSRGASYDNSNISSANSSISGSSSITGTHSGGHSSNYTGSHSSSGGNGFSSSYQNGSDGLKYSDEYHSNGEHSYSHSYSANGSRSDSVTGSMTGSSNSAITGSMTGSSKNYGESSSVFSSSGAIRQKGSHWYTRNWLYTHFSELNLKVHALIEQGKGRIISQPNVTTMGGKTAGILIGGKVPYPVSNGDNSTSVDYQNYGVELDLIRPEVDRDGNVTSRLYASVSRLDWANAVMVNGYSMPGLATRSAETMINIPSGMTMAIGGLMNSSDVDSVSGVPVLSKIPVLGDLFKHHNKTREKTEIMILITPRVVNETTTAQMSKEMHRAYADTWHEDQAKYRINLNDTKDIDHPEDPPAVKQAKEKKAAEQAKKKQAKAKSVQEAQQK